jgi:thioredoxin-related protein
MLTLIFKSLALLAAGGSLVLAGGDAWLTDFEQAKEQAQKDNKAILINFTGSDWCSWCIMLHKEVFSHKEFLTYAKNKFVLLELDFPRNKELPEKQKEQNEKLSKQFSIEGFPTVILTDATGKKFARTGYQEGGAKAYIKHLDELLEKKDLD